MNYFILSRYFVTSHPYDGVLTSTNSFCMLDRPTNATIQTATTKPETLFTMVIITKYNSLCRPDKRKVGVC